MPQTRAKIEEEHHKFLEALLNDDFRADFQKNPQPALVKLGLLDEVSEDRPKTVPTLPSKEAVQEVLDGAKPTNLFFFSFCAPVGCAFSASAE